MNQQLQNFISDRCHLTVAATVKLKDVLDRFHEWLPECDRRGWTRSRLILELGKSFVIGVDSSRILRVAGLSFQPPAAWTVVDGKLTHA